MPTDPDVAEAKRDANATALAVARQQAKPTDKLSADRNWQFQIFLARGRRKYPPKRVMVSDWTLATTGRTTR